jgi:hypothetical protein
MPSSMNWGDVSSDEEGEPISKAIQATTTHDTNSKTQEESSLKKPAKSYNKKVPAYIQADARVCQIDGAYTVTRVEAQRFAKLLYDLDRTTILKRYLATHTRPQYFTSKEGRMIPTEENVRHAYFELVCRIGICYDAIRANANFEEAPYRNNWYKVHMERANDLYHPLLQAVDAYTYAVQNGNGEMRDATQKQFCQTRDQMRGPLPRLDYVTGSVH